jgi:hypothetical protein
MIRDNVPVILKEIPAKERMAGTITTFTVYEEREIVLLRIMREHQPAWKLGSKDDSGLKDCALMMGVYRQAVICEYCLSATSTRTHSFSMLIV